MQQDIARCACRRSLFRYALRRSVEGGRPIAPPLEHAGPVRAVVFHPDGQRLATASDDKTARVWDAATGRAVLPPLQHETRVICAAYSPDGSRLLTACSDTSLAECEARLWDAKTGRPVARPLRHGDGVLWAAFGADGRLVATASEDRSARIWDAATGEPLSPPLRHAQQVLHAAFDAGGGRLVTTCLDGTARLWDVATGEPLTPPIPHGPRLQFATLHPDGRRLLTAGLDGTVQIRRLPAEDRAPALAILRARLLAGHRVDHTGGYVPLEPAEILGGWEQLRASDPAGVAPPTPALRAEWHRGEAASLSRRKLWRPATWHLDRLAELRPNDAQLRLDRGHAHRQLGQRVEALADFAAAIERAPGDPAAWGFHAEVLGELGRWDEAASDLARWAELGGEPDPIPWYFHAALRLRVGDEEGYRRACALMLERFGRTDDPRTSGLVARSATLGRDAVDRPDRLVELAKRYATANPRSGWALFGLAMAHLRAGDPREAIRRAEESLEVEPGWVGAPMNWSLLAMACDASGDRDAARRWREKADDDYARSSRGEAPAIPVWNLRLESELLRRELERAGAGGGGPPPNSHDP
jgi:tetratricopeptide (TPR) repeat protein